MMNCHEVLERVAAPSRGGTSLTERALVHAHVEQCVDCQAERAALLLAVNALPPIEPSRGAAVSAAAAHVIARGRFVIARVARSLISRCSSVLSVCQATARAASRAAGTGATRVVAVLGRLRLMVSASLTVRTRAGVGALGAAWTRLTRVAGLLPTLFRRLARAAGGLVGHARFVRARVPRLVIWPGAALLGACQATARAAREASSTGATRLRGLPSRLGALVAISSGVFVEAAGRVIAAGRAGARRILDHLFRAGARVPVLVASSVRIVGRGIAMIPARAWAHSRLCAGVASLVVLVASLVFLGPPHRPDTRVPLRDVRLPVDLKPAVPAVVAPLVQAAPPPRVSGPQPVAAPRAAAPEAHAALPVPVRRSAAPAPQPATGGTRNAEASDPTAAIDWLLQRSGRGHAEHP